MSETSPDSLHNVQIALDGRGRGTVLVDGNDLSGQVTGLHVNVESGEAPEVVLVGHPRRGVEFGGFARVYVGETPDPGPAAAAFLEAIDPKALEEAALSRPDLTNEPHALTAAMLDQLCRWARGEG